MSQEAIDRLKAAVEVSPDNIPLRVALAELLMSLSRDEEAEREFRAALAGDPGNSAVKLGLARAFYQQGKSSAAMVIVEELIKSPGVAPAVRLLYARLLDRAGQTDFAARQYAKAVDEDPRLVDLAFADHLGASGGGTGGKGASASPSARAGHDGADDPDHGYDDEHVVDGKARQTWEGDAATAAGEIERPKIAFADVGGLDEVKEEIRIKIIHPLEHADLYKAYGKAIGGGILMYGPPGCGKTFLARATAGEIKSNFISIGISDVLDMYIGKSEKNLAALFDQARQNKPCVLFFDEVDALAASRADMRTSAGRHLINQFLSELDGVTSNNDGLLILAATNAPWHVDPAFRRPGRFDRILFVPPPDAPARAAVLRAMLAGKPTKDVDADHVAKKTDAFSGADLKAVVDLTIEAKLRDSMKTGLPLPIVTKDLLTAAARVKPSTKEWFNTARNYALYANQGGAYDEIRKFLKL